MLNGSVRVLAPATVCVMSGMPGTMYRSVSATAVSQPYFWLGLFSGQRDQDDETDRRSGAESGSEGFGFAANVTPQDVREMSGGVSSSQSYFQAQAGRVLPRSGNGPPPPPPSTMHIDERPGQSSAAVMEEVVSSREMVSDFVRHCLQKEGIAWENGQRDATPSEVQGAMRGLGDELVTRYGEDFDRNVSSVALTPERGQETVTVVMNEMFSEGGVSWGRIVALVTFAGKLAVQCTKRQPQQLQPLLFGSIVDWVSNYLDTDIAVKSWVARNNGWAGLVDFYRGSESHSKESWPQLKTVITVFAAAAGALTLGALMKS